MSGEEASPRAVPALFTTKPQARAQVLASSIVSWFRQAVRRSHPVWYSELGRRNDVRIFHPSGGFRRAQKRREVLRASQSAKPQRPIGAVLLVEDDRGAFAERWARDEKSGYQGVRSRKRRSRYGQIADLPEGALLFTDIACRRDNRPRTRRGGVHGEARSQGAVQLRVCGSRRSAKLGQEKVAWLKQLYTGLT